MNDVNHVNDKIEDGELTPLRRRILQRKRAQQRRKAILPCIPFFVALGVLTVIAWILPLRPTLSENEKRILTEFPQFSFSSLADGSFFEGVDSWFSDTFTFRDSWISLSDQVEDLHGTGEVVIYGTISAGESIPQVIIPPPVSDTEADVSVPNTSAGDQAGDISLEVQDDPQDAQTDDPQDISQSEPDTSVSDADQAQPDDGEATDDGEDEQPPADDSAQPEEEQPEEDTSNVASAGATAWGGEVLDADEYFSQGAVIQIGDAAYNVPGFSQYQCDRYVSSMNRALELLDGRARLYTITVPTSITYMLSRSDREFMGLTLEEDGLEYMYSQFAPGVNYVDIYDTLVRHNNEYLCFRTDHHWTALGAYYAYVEWCKVAGFDPVPLDAYEVIEYPGYLGTTYYSAQKSSLLGQNPDTVVCYVPPGDVHLYIQEGSSDRLGYETSLIINRSNSSSGSKYLAFLAGDNAKCTFINNDITDGSACLIIKNSQGNPFVYYYTQHYQYVYVVDPRYYFARGLVSFVEEYDIDDVIFCTGAAFTWGNGGNDLISYFVR